MTKSTKAVTVVLNSTIQSAKDVVPLEIEVGKPTLITSPIKSDNYNVLIGVVGDTKGRIIIESPVKTLKAVAEQMFGMQVEGEMLTSFFGELGNMVAGKMCTYTYDKSVKLDITPPTVMVGDVEIHGFSKAIRIPVTAKETQEVVFITLALEEI